MGLSGAAAGGGEQEVFHAEVAPRHVMAESVEVTTPGGIVGEVTVRYRVSEQSTVTQVIRVTTESPVVEVRHEVEWHESHKLLKVEHDVGVRRDTARFQMQFGFVERPTHANTSWDAAKFEVCGHQVRIPSPPLSSPDSSPESSGRQR